MESSFSRYIWLHTSRQQLWILAVVLISMIPYYMAFDLPKMIINGPIQGGGFESPGSTQALQGIELDRMQTLLALSLGFLSLVIINGIFKYHINTYKGLLGERLLRRVRFDLIDRVLRFLPGEFKRMKGGEISSMIKDEVEPLGGFTGEAFVQPVMLGGQALTALVFIFSGSIEENLLYGLKHSPLDDVHYSDKAAKIRQWELHEAQRTGNPVFDLMSNWVDSVTVNGYSDSGGIAESVKQVLAVTHLLDDVFDFALHSKLESRNSEELDKSIISLRVKVREALQRQGLSELIIPFDKDRYNPQAKVLDNIIFGILTHSPTSYQSEEASAYFRDTMRKTGLDAMLVKMGLAIAENSRELFQNLADDHPFFDRLDFMSSEEIPRYRLLYQRTRHKEFMDISIEDRSAWIELSYLYSEPQYRFGLLDEALMQKVVETRK